ncbi:MAG: bifunctional DNA primase/polymerase [Thermoplasmata archaeon]
MVTYNDAKKLYDLGFSVIPLKEKSKTPLEKWEEFQNRRATEQELHKWFDNGKNNIAVITGKVSGNLIVIDFDNLDILPFIIDDIQNIAKETMIVRTGKGIHIYFKCNEKYLATKKFENLKIDIKGEGGYVVAPPSIHPSGAVYTFEGANQVKYNEKMGELLEFLEEKDKEAQYLWKILPYWQPGKRNFLVVGLTVFFKIKLSWDVEKINNFIQGINRMRPFAEDPYRPGELRAKIVNAYEKEYNYQKFLDDDLILELNKIIPKNANVIWELTLQETNSEEGKIKKTVICTKEGVQITKFLEKNNEKTKNIISTTPVFSRPLILANAWKLADGIESDLKFQVLLGDYEYVGTKDEIIKQIMEKAVTGINITNIKEVVNACVEYYISTKQVEVKNAYGAVGIYEENNKFIIVLPGQPEHPLNTIPNTEPWFVEKEFTMKNDYDMEKILTAYNKLPFYFNENTLIVLFGLSAFYPFAYVLKKKPNIFIPLLIIKGARGTGKSTITELFTKILYGIKEGGPSDVTSDFRLLDFLTGTTFPRMVDETENAKFRGNKFQKGVEDTLKDASARQLVGKRGTIERKKDLYMARTPLILVGNKIDLTDPALMIRSIILNFGVEKQIKNHEDRMKFKNEILNNINDADGFGIELLKFVMENIQNSNELYDIINNLRNGFKVNFIDARRADFYAEIYFGLTIWNQFFEKYGMTFSLNKYLDREKFRNFIIEIEHLSQEEGEERQEILGFMDWVKTKYAIRKELWENAVKNTEYEHIPETVSIIDQIIKFDEDEKQKWLYFTQTAITEYKKENRDFPYNSLTEVADAIAEFYGQKSEIFYPKKSIWIGKRVCKAVRIPFEDHYQPSVDSFGNDDGGKGPPEKPNQPNQNLTKPGYVENVVQDILSHPPNQPNQKIEFFSYSKLEPIWFEKNAFFPVRLVRFNIQDNKYSVKNEENNKKENLTKNLTKPNQWLGKDEEMITLLIKKEFNYKNGDYTLHCYPNDILRIEYNIAEKILKSGWGDRLGI